MRTTLDIDADVLTAAKEMARREKSTAGRLISRLLRERLTGMGREGDVPTRSMAPVTAAGFRTLPSSGVLITNELIDRLRDEEGV